MKAIKIKFRADPGMSWLVILTGVYTCRNIRCCVSSYCLLRTTMTVNTIVKTMTANTAPAPIPIPAIIVQSMHIRADACG